MFAADHAWHQCLSSCTKAVSANRGRIQLELYINTWQRHLFDLARDPHALTKSQVMNVNYVLHLIIIASPIIIVKLAVDLPAAKETNAKSNARIRKVNIILQ